MSNDQRREWTEQAIQEQSDLNEAAEILREVWPGDPSDVSRACKTYTAWVKAYRDKTGNYIARAKHVAFELDELASDVVNHIGIATAWGRHEVAESLRKVLKQLGPCINAVARAVSPTEEKVVQCESFEVV